jgi:hypothetical protein
MHVSTLAVLAVLAVAEVVWALHLKRRTRREIRRIGIFRQLGVPY